MQAFYYMIFLLIVTHNMVYSMNKKSEYTNIDAQDRFQPSIVETYGKKEDFGYRKKHGEKLVIFKDAVSRYKEDSPDQIAQRLTRIAPYIDSALCQSTQEYTNFKYYDLETIIPLLHLTIACRIIPHNRICEQFKACDDKTIEWSGELFSSASDYKEYKAVEILHTQLINKK